MKECKNSGMLPCYRDGYGVWHYSDDTHDKVYELNKQMCDLGKRLSDPLDPPSEETMKRACDVLERHLKTMRELNRANKKSIEITEEHIKIINRFMEEKKTKKMTKAEAFEWLNNKKLTAKDDVYVKVLFKLFECGIEWAVGGQSFTYYGSDFLIIEGGKLFHCGNDGEDYWRSHHFEEISAEDILSLEIVEDEPLDKWDEFARCVAKVQEKIDDDEVCIITKGNFLTMTK